ncbi:MAG: sialate O-acetylesterase, partial [Bacteroidales bacterium]|nr:sialate O-acetylesterase [Bacteroidales bacterium]
MNNKFTFASLVFIMALLIHNTALSDVRLPELISNGMVLQRNAEIKIWGRADANENIVVSFKDSSFHTVADKSGKWSVNLPPMKAGGPWTMTIRGNNTIRLKDVLLGEVWISSGQSNMELPIRRVRPVYESEIISSKNHSIRYFDVPQEYNFNRPETDLESGRWKKSNPENVLEFSAVAYFFAKKLYETYHVPVGIINASVGGSPAEAWISEDVLRDKFSEYHKKMQRFKDTALIRKIRQQDQKRMQDWYKRLQHKDKGYKTPNKTWHDQDISTSGWSEMEIPGYWSEGGPGKMNGVVWFRRKVDVPSVMAAGKPAKLILGRIVDADSAFVNGRYVGNTTYQYPPRIYDIPGGLLHEGNNTITLRCVNVNGYGGFIPDKPYRLVTGYQSIDLIGNWKYRIGTKMKPLAPQTFIRWKPVGLYNAMIAPLLNYRIKGVIWYQGESNTDRAREYKKLFPTLIKNWRGKWDQGDFPFLYVQLANYMKPQNEPSKSNWALLREAQLKTLSVPNTGMAVTIDIGEWNDIHPLNKKDVGKRLTLAARKIAYDEDDVVFSGPIYESMKVENDRIVLTFNHVGSG